MSSSSLYWQTRRYTVIDSTVHLLSRYLLYGTEIMSEYKNFFSEAQLRPKGFIWHCGQGWQVISSCQASRTKLKFDMLCWHGLYGLGHTVPKLDETSKISFLRSSYVQYLSLDTLTNHVRCHPHPCIGKPVGTPSSTVQYICCHGICYMGLKSCPNRKISFLRPSCVQKLSFDTVGKVNKWHLHAKPVEQSWNSTCYNGMGSTV